MEENKERTLNKFYFLALKIIFSYTNRTYQAGERDI